jgi:pyruvate/2-oxoglutarate dehydrogenase complex dihydrolipoamide dehydrogenase (E3) component
MTERLEPDLCVIGGGSAGLAVAAGAVQMGASVVLVERGKMGGDCLNYGCVPSKALLAAGKMAKLGSKAEAFGVSYAAPRIDGSQVRDHVRSVIAAIAPHDSVERFERLGCRVIQGEARFTAPDRMMADGVEIEARRFVLATGSTAAVPSIPGLASIPYLTNESIFDLDRRPERLVVIGAGPIGAELAQAHRHLGSDVVLVEMAALMGKDDPDLVDVVRRRLKADGIELLERTRVVRIVPTTAGANVVVDRGAGEVTIEATHVLVAAGRRPVLDRRVYAIGDAAGGPQFTHVAGYHAGILIRNALFRLPAKVSYAALPWATFTDPELAQVGLTEAEAKTAGTPVQVLTWPFRDNDRAQTERTIDGQVKVVLGRRGRILGCGIVGPHAGELIQPWCLAIANGLKIGAMAGVVLPYPTLGEISKRAAGSYFTPTLYGDRVRRLVRFLLRLA